MDDASPQGSSIPNTPPPMYGEIPGVVPFRQGGGSGPPPSYKEANDPTAPPPTYDSLFGRMREARKNSSGILDFLKRLSVIILGTLGCTVLLGITIVIPMSMLIIGAMYQQSCPAEPYIPIYLVVGGTFWCLKKMMKYGFRCKGRDEEADERRLRQSPVNILMLLIGFFLFAWFIAGCVWIYRIYPPNYTDKDNAEYCNKTLYLFAFWLITSTYIILGLLTSCLCCISIASMLFLPE